MRTTTPAAEQRPERLSANERLKRSFRAWLWSSMIAATVVHFAAFALWPELTAADIGVTGDVLEVIEPLDEIELPEAPDELTRPAEPVIGPADIPDDVTIATTSLEDYPVDRLPPPPEDPEAGASRTTTLVPYTVPPMIRNMDEVVQAMERAYPRPLRDAGIGGTVHVLFRIDERGVVRDFEIDRSSGHSTLDEAALSVAGVYRFSPALNRDQRVAVWVSFPITFQVRQ